MYPIDKSNLYNFLYDNNIYNLYHSGTVKASCNLIKMGGLPSITYMINKETPYTDILLDVVDIREQYDPYDFCRPIIFVIDCAFLKEFNGDICIFRNNPIYHKRDLEDKDIYYRTLEEYISDFREFVKAKPENRKMIALFNSSGVLPFERFLKKVIIDKASGHTNNTDYAVEIKEALMSNFIKSKLHRLFIEIREYNRL